MKYNKKSLLAVTQFVYFPQELQVIHTHREVWFLSHVTPQIRIANERHIIPLEQSQMTETELSYSDNITG